MGRSKAEERDGVLAASTPPDSRAPADAVVAAVTASVWLEAPLAAEEGIVAACCCGRDGARVGFRRRERYAGRRTGQRWIFNLLDMKGGVHG